MSRKEPDGSRRRRGSRSEAASDEGFDRWLNRQLHGLYDPVLAEAVPPEILKLIEQFEARPDPPPGKDDEDGSGQD